MKRTRVKRHSGLGRGADKLIRLATGLAESGCRLEARYWAQQLDQLIDELLQNDEETTLNATLDHIYHTHDGAYEILANHIESRAESTSRPETGQDILLIAAPVLAWSRYRIPTAAIPSAVLANLRSHLKAHVLADNVNIALADVLFSPDQLPQGYCPTAAFTALLGQAAQDNLNLHIDPNTLAETSLFLSDTRYLLAAIVIEKNAPVFRWQDHQGNRTHALTQWRNQASACLSPLLPGCALEVVLPEAYFAASRAADNASRPYAVRASVAFLSTTLGAPASELRAVIAPFYERQLEEYRIGFTLSGKNDVVHGIVWPLLGAEDDIEEDPNRIEMVLRECGVSDILRLEHRFPLEYCDDCGAPLYPSPEGEMVHAEMPDEHTESAPPHLH